MEKNTSNGVATTEKSTFSMENSVFIKINGEIVSGGRVKLVSKLDPKRTFNLKISEFQPPHKLVWKDGFAPMFQGVRTYDLLENTDGTTTFKMAEVLSGLMLPMIIKSLPDFKSNFEQIARDLKNTVEHN